MTRIRALSGVLLLTVALLCGTATAAAQPATPDPADLPQSAPPFGLATVTLPVDEEGIDATFNALPETVAGEQQGSWVRAEDRTLVPYGDEDPSLGYPLVIRAVSFERGDFFPPDFTPGDYVTGALTTDEADTTSGGRAGNLAWVRSETTIGGAGADRTATPPASQPVYTLAWGDIDGSWIFTATASSPEQLEALVTAFVEAVGGEPATPQNLATPAV